MGLTDSPRPDLGSLVPLARGASMHIWSLAFLVNHHAYLSAHDTSTRI